MKKISIFLLAALVLCALSSCATQEKSTSELPTQNQTETTAQGVTQESTEESTQESTEESTQESTEESTQGETQSPTENPQSAEAQAKYAEALEFLASGKYQEAYDVLNEIKDYPDAQEKLANFFYAPSKRVCTVYYSDGDIWGYTDQYTYSPNGNLLKIDFWRDGKISSSDEFTYDSQGRLLTGVSLYGDPLTYFYDAEGRISKIVTSYDSGSGADYYHYNENGDLFRVISEAGYGDEYRYEYENGKISKMMVCDVSKGVTESEYYTTYIFNDKGLLVKVAGSYGDPSVLEYDSNGRLIKFTDTVKHESEFYGTTITTNTLEYSYSEDGTLKSVLKKSIVERNGEIIDESTRTYTYEDYKLYYNTAADEAQKVLSINEVYFYDYDVIMEEFY